MNPGYITTINISDTCPDGGQGGSISMDVLLRGLCELQIDKMLDESLIHEYSALLKEMDIPEESRSCFLKGYVAGRARTNLNASSLAMFNRSMNGDEIDVFSEVLGRRIDDILGKVLDHEIEKLANEEKVIEEPQPEVNGEYEESSEEEGIEEVPLQTVATIGDKEAEGEKFSFKISGKKTTSPTILGIPVNA